MPPSASDPADAIGMPGTTQTNTKEIGQTNWPEGARFWSDAEISASCKTMREGFRERRFAEPQDVYLRNFDALEAACQSVISNLEAILSDPIDCRLIANLVGSKDTFAALRYVTAPIISEDDLKTLVGGSIAAASMRGDPERASSFRNVIRSALDPRRFPWIFEGRASTREEQDAAVLASTVYAAGERSKTGRRSDEKSQVEGAVRQTLLELGMVPSKVRSIKTLMGSGMLPGQFTESSCRLKDHEADVVAVLYDHRLLAIECKGSNSEINSRKRINKEVLIDAREFWRIFGEGQVIPAAVIQGVFNPRYISQAQRTPVVFFWSHDLSDLTKLVSSTKS